MKDEAIRDHAQDLLANEIHVLVDPHGEVAHAGGRVFVAAVAEIPLSVLEARNLQVEEVEGLRRDNLTLRRLVWISHGCFSLYGDDGEMSCGTSEHGCCDFKREPVDRIEAHIVSRGFRELAKGPIPTREEMEILRARLTMAEEARDAALNELSLAGLEDRR